MHLQDHWANVRRPSLTMPRGQDFSQALGTHWVSEIEFRRLSVYGYDSRQSLLGAKLNLKKELCCDSLVGLVHLFLNGKHSIKCKVCSPKLLYPESMYAHTFSFPSPSTPRIIKIRKVWQRERTLRTCSSISFSISSASWSSTMWCAVGKAVCSLLMMAVDSEMKHSGWDSSTQFSESVP